MGIRDKIKNAEVSLWPFGMGMTIDEAMNYLITPEIASTKVTLEMQKQLDAHAVAIDTMRKYQQIEKLYKVYLKDLTTNIYADRKFIKALNEVLGDENDD